MTDLNSKITGILERQIAGIASRADNIRMIHLQAQTLTALPPEEKGEQYRVISARANEMRAKAVVKGLNL